MVLSYHLSIKKNKKFNEKWLNKKSSSKPDSNHTWRLDKFLNPNRKDRDENVGRM